MPIPGHDVGAEGVAAPGSQGVQRGLAQLRILAAGQVHQDVLDPFYLAELEGADPPVSVRSREIPVVGGIEDVVEPALGRLEPAIPAQVDPHGQGHVVEELPVVDRVGTRGREVYVMDGEGGLDDVRRLVANR